MSTSVEAPSGKGKSDENFPVGSRLIRASLRPHVHAFYDFARQADDIADSATLSSEDKVARLDVMGAVLVGDKPDGSPSATRLRASLAETGVTAQHSLDLLRAFRQDATKLRYASWDELIEYCRYSAMPVGRHVLDLHGESTDTYEPSDALCASLQVLNHMQDCAGDLAELDRCYIPQDMLAAAGLTTDAVTASAASPGFRQVLNQMVELTQGLNRAGAALPRRVKDRRLRVETAVIAGLAKRLTGRLHREDPLAGRVKLRRGDVVGSVLLALPWLR
ncbi:squalene synthase HpnC [Acidisphaera sp. L21]|uniref:squalene synthase HpnC n=1 Tax=Acidisphaera sp. L21 TaxID=1641851 RepID=UPI00131DB823|nr:squalene synthase HpnC [Acidisphaera sp. L21]